MNDDDFHEFETDKIQCVDGELAILRTWFMTMTLSEEEDDQIALLHDFTGSKVSKQIKVRIFICFLHTLFVCFLCVLIVLCYFTEYHFPYKNSYLCVCCC